MKDHQTVNRPDIFIVGTMKGGTTILHEFLSLHPEIHAGTQKEIHYFSLFDTKGPDWYHAHFSHLPPDQHYLDASPTYFDMANEPVIPRRIHDYNPDARVIMMARDPIDRALSHFNHLRKINKIEALRSISPEEFFSRDLEAAVSQIHQIDMYLMQCLNFSLYFRKAHNYRTVFGDRFLAVENESLSQDPQQTMERIFRHIGVDPIRDERFGERKYSHQDKNATYPLSPETTERLNNLFNPNYNAFCKLTGLPNRRPAAKPAAKPAPRPATKASPAAAARAPDKPTGPFEQAFIISYPHAGAGIVQEALNTVPGICIRGGNGGVLVGVAQLAAGLDKAQRQKDGAAGPGSAWFGAPEIQARAFADKLSAGFVDHVLRPPKDSHIIGCTETRLMPRPEFVAYCNYLRLRFPRALLIFNTRDTGRVIAANRASGEVANEHEYARADQLFRKFAAAHPDRCIEIAYDDYIGNEAALKPLFDRLGVPFNAAAVRSILARANPNLPLLNMPERGRIENGVLSGRDGWLFLWTGSNNVHRYYTQDDHFTDKHARDWADLLTARRDRLAGLGIRYLHMTAPDKLSVYPEHVGRPLPHHDRHPARLLAQLVPGNDLNLDVLPDLRAADLEGPVFYKSDSHWNFRGCQAAYRRLCETLGVAPRDFSDRKVGGKAMALDLGNKFSPPVIEEARFTHVLRDARRVLANGPVRYNEETGFRQGSPRFVGCYVHLQNSLDDAHPQTVMLFGDSFSEFRPHLLTAMLAETFREVHFIWSANLDYELIERVRPQIVISQIAERFMATLPTDEFRVSLD
ncbi:SGNH hydrolase-like domain-containing protein, acetyltransferase AlgX [Paracoccus halophilus]|uniref:SGNH hydrolase-like domain-containing protein, acetyltransferase AlgX n=1 Tax=Paracoccus halophilus TaxID=376733 RepID=A0A1I0SWJ4_9RHOB|nr:sulfotransferase [Paracoccus halophilus]SFA43879.1 SGNH hydrolase-like domain-containing protein, acetyltransferase AlgX [Paracoccus halophilus]